MYFGLEVIADIAPEEQVRGKQCAGDHCVAEPLEWNAVVDGATGDKDTRNKGEIGREDAAYSPMVEASDREVVILEVAQDATGYQVTGDDKEHVHAAKAARAQPWKDMKQQDRQHG